MINSEIPHDKESLEEHIIAMHLREIIPLSVANKILNGVPAEKDGKKLINKKSIKSFLQYICEKMYNEAKMKNVSGYQAVAKEGTAILEQAIEYFDNDKIVGDLYDESGTLYKKAPEPPKNVAKSIQTAVTQKQEPQKPQQFTLFSLLEEKQVNEQPPVQEPTKEKNIKPVEEIEDDNDGELQTLVPEDIDDGAAEPVNDEIIEMNVTEDTQQPCTWKVNRTTGEILSKNPIEKKTVSLQASPLYQKYMRFQNQYPHAVIAYRLGDFFEVFGDNAVKLANNFNLTLTGRDCGLEERVPMVGFPYHASDIYFKKIFERFELVVVEDNVATPYGYDDDKADPYAPLEEENEPTVYENNDKPDDDLEELRASAKAFEQTALCSLLEIFGEEIMIPEEDY